MHARRRPAANVEILMVLTPPNGSRLSCGRARTTLAAADGRRRVLPRPAGRRPTGPHAPDRGRLDLPREVDTSLGLR